MKENRLLVAIAVFSAVLSMDSFTATIDVISASYGQNCGVKRGNVTHYISSACNGKTSCTYHIDHTKIGDPAFGCAKNFVVDYRCGNERLQSAISPEASGKNIDLECRETIHVRSATYGKNCGVRQGNVTHYVASICNDRSSCSYPVDHTKIGDPAFGCAKDFIVEWECGDRVLSDFASPEASGKRVLLHCDR